MPGSLGGTTYSNTQQPNQNNASTLQYQNQQPGGANLNPGPGTGPNPGTGGFGNPTPGLAGLSWLL
jgi:hypothetical protein